MEIRSASGVGTAFTVELPLRDVPLPRATVWSLRPVRALLLLLAFGVGSMGATLLRTPAVDSVQIAGTSRIVARGEDGTICWERDLRLRINRNYLAPSYTADDERDRDDSPLILRSPSGAARLIVLAMQPAQGPGQIWFLDARGRTRRSRTLPWTSPQGLELGKLNSVWQAAVPWTGNIEQAVVIQIRDNRYSPSATVFFSPEGDSIGAYYHWGQLQFHSASDLDMDGKTEILLFGVANHAQHDRTVVPRDPEVYIDCIVMLEVPRVSGQAYPHSDWPGIPPAEEEAYLLLPPLFEGLRAEIRGIDVGSAAPGEPPPIEVVLMDGRIYRLDSRLRPLSCATGDYTAARRMGVTRAMAPVTYFHEGRRESIDLPVQ